MNIFDILIFLDPQYFRYYLYFSDLVIVLVTHTIRLGFPSLNSPAPTFLLMLSLEIDICITRRLKDLINTELKSAEMLTPISCRHYIETELFCYQVVAACHTLNYWTERKKKKTGNYIIVSRPGTLLIDRFSRVNATN